MAYEVNAVTDRLRDASGLSSIQLNARDLLIYPDFRHPYYIVSPPYVRTSAGIRSLYLLCHALNRLGHVAYIIQDPVLRPAAEAGGPDLLTPFLTPRIAEDHHARGLVPIVVYPETVLGNPLRAPCIVRYVCNFPGLLGGDVHYPADEMCFSYSETIAAHTDAPENVLFIPATDTRIFRPPKEESTRSGSCFYADKYRAVHAGRLLDVTKNSVEITRDLPDSQTPAEIAALFHRSEVFYTYENTALAIEAVLCGCPAVFIPNPYLTEIIAARELGPDGYAWGTGDPEVARARASVAQGAACYLQTYRRFWRDLDRFVQLSQEHAEGRPYPVPVRVPQLPHISRLQRVSAVWQRNGTAWVARKVMQRITHRARRAMRSSNPIPASVTRMPNGPQP